MKEPKNANAVIQYTIYFDTLHSITAHHIQKWYSQCFEWKWKLNITSGLLTAYRMYVLLQIVCGIFILAVVYKPCVIMQYMIDKGVVW